MNDLTDDEIGKLILILKEKPRATQSANRTYIDTGNNLELIRLKRHSVVFGRRGSGKTMLLSELKKSSGAKEDSSVIWIDIDDYKTLAFPDILIQILRSIFTGVQKEIRSVNSVLRHPIRRIAARDTLNRLKKEEDELSEMLRRFEESSLTVEHARSSKNLKSKRDRVSGGGKGIQVEAGEESSRETHDARKESAEGRDRKIDRISRHLHDAKQLLRDASTFVRPVIHIVLDDFYHLAVEDQASVLDFLQSLTKNLDVYVKFGTIAHRSRLFRQGEKVIFGMQQEHDVLAIDLDRTFQNFTEVEQFIEQLWHQTLGSHDLSACAKIFGGESWKQLVLASGGTPRDFMNILAKALEIGRRKKAANLGVNVINEAANLYLRETKQQDLISDKKETTVELEDMLSDIRSFCVDLKKRNLFLVDKDSLDQSSHQQELLRQLLDYRFVHLVHSNTSSVGRKGRYEAYMLDVGLYSHPPRRGKNRVSQVDFLARDDQHRADAIRTQSIYPLKEAYIARSHDSPFEPLKESEESDNEDTDSSSDDPSSESQMLLDF